MDDSKIAFVTGATAGIGKHIALGLARAGMQVIVGARNRAKGNDVAAEITVKAGLDGRRDPPVSVAVVDVSRPQSIAALELGVDRLDVLVNNAGVWFTDRTETPDGLEITFATNLLGPHLVTTKLAPLMMPGGRVVNVVSGFANHYDVTDLEFRRRKYDGYRAYAQSKQALRMLTWSQAARYAGKLTVNAAAPGFVKTDFGVNTHGFMSMMIGLSAKLFAVSPDKGAETPLMVATAPALAGVTGKYFDANKEKDGKFREPAAIAELERALDAYATRKAA